MEKQLHIKQFTTQKFHIIIFQKYLKRSLLILKIDLEIHMITLHGHNINFFIKI